MTLRDKFALAYIQHQVTREEGQTMAEYGLLLALIAVVCIATLGFLGGGINDKFNAVLNGL